MSPTTTQVKKMKMPKRPLQDIRQEAYQGEQERGGRYEDFVRRHGKEAADQFFGEGKRYPLPRIDREGNVDEQFRIDLERNIDADLLEGKEPLKKQRKSKPLSTISDLRMSGVEPTDEELRKPLEKLRKLRKERGD